LPASLAGKEVAFIAQKPNTPAHAKTELFWIGVSQTGSKKANQSSSLTNPTMINNSLTKHAKILSALPAGMKSDQPISARIDAIKGQHMNLSLMLQDVKNPGKSIRHQMLTTSIEGLKQGQSISAKIISGANNKALLEITTRQAANQSPIKTTNMANFKLAAGDTVAAFVQQRLSNDRVQLNIRGTIVEAPAPATVKKGDVLMLKMHQPPANFQLLSAHKNAAAKALASLKSNLTSNNQSMAQNITSIRNLMPPPTAGPLPASNGLPPINGLPQLDNALKLSASISSTPLDGKRVGEMIRNAGTGLESKLLNLSQHPAMSPSLQQDFKAIMLQLANLPSSNAQQAELIKALNELGRQGASRIEATQALNVLTHMQGEAMRLELPMLVNQQMVNVQLSIQQQQSYESGNEDEGDAADQAYHILFALELSQLGHIRIDANISDTSVHARIYNDNPRSNQFIVDNMQRLETRLQNLGFEKVYLLTSQQPPDADKQQRFDQLTQMTSASLNLLDIRI